LRFPLFTIEEYVIADIILEKRKAETKQKKEREQQ
jgi:hypothetical protein